MSGTSTGGQGAGGDAGAVATAGDGGDAGAQQGPDLSAITSQLEGLSTGQEDLRQLIQTFSANLDEGGDGELGDELDLRFLEDPTIDASAMAQRLSDQMGTLTSQQVQALMAPVQDQMKNMEQQLADQQLSRDFDALVSEFPEIGEKETAEELLGLSGQMAQQMGAPQLATKPAFMRVVFMAARAAEAANGEGNAPSAAHLEGAGGAVPGGGQQGGMTADSIINAHKGSKALPF